MHMSFRDYLDLELDDSIDIGKEKRYDCPFCDDTKHRFYVKVSSDNTDGLWFCQKCKESGNPVSFVMKYNGVGYREARDILEMYVDEDMFQQNYRELGLTDSEIMYLMLIQTEEDDEEEEDKTLVPPQLPVGTKLIMQNLDNPEVAPFVDYLVNTRNLPPEVICKHNIGYITKGYAVTESGKRATLDNHVVFFTYDNNGEYIYWNTRSILPDPYIKSFNGVARDGERSKRNVVFNLNIARKYDKMVIVEGVIDALTIGDNAVATFGSHVTDNQIGIILDNIKPETQIYVMLDRDAPKESLKTADRLYAKHKNTFIVISPTDEDANDIGTERAWEVINNHSVKANSDQRLALLLTN